MNKIEPATIKEIRMIYTDGTVISIPETKALTVGNMFMKLIAKEKMEWKVLKAKKSSFLYRVYTFFNL